ncbi:MAG: hypothetical protein JWN73_2677 [Betaproteobacteria bacterium]|nr:hypothetical protein [Betaproteobacteria bacterium]
MEWTPVDIPSKTETTKSAESSCGARGGLLEEPAVAPGDRDLHDLLMAILAGMCRCGVRGI